MSSHVVAPDRALGRLGPRPEHYVAGQHFVALDPARHLAEKLPIPDGVDYATPRPPLYLGHNDTLGSCGPTGVANGLSTKAKREGRETVFAKLLNVDDAIRDLYLTYTKGMDSGVILLDWLHYLQTRDDGFLGEKIGWPIAINPRSQEEVWTALTYGDGLYFGATMSQASVSSPPGSFWRTDEGDQTDVGGHCGYAPGFIRGIGQSYDEPNISVESWRELFYVTWSWWYSRVDEAYILVDLARPRSAFNLDVLRYDISQLDVEGVKEKVA